jgi:arginase family enzyme
VNATAVFFPFDLFGSPGTSAGALAVAEAVAELQEDNRRERSTTRARAYNKKLRCQHLALERLQDYEEWQHRARQVIRRLFRRDDFLIWVTGNHLGVLPAYEELARADPEALVVQLDAHLDVQAFSGYSKEPSHANFLLHCSQQPAIINIGSRDLLLPQEHVKKYYRAVYSAERLFREEEHILKEISVAVGSASRVFIDIDCDVLDPAYFPAVAHGVPFGLSPSLLLRCLHACWSDRIVGMALSEFEPARDGNDRSLGLLVWLIEHLLLKRFESSVGRVPDSPCP